MKYFFILKEELCLELKENISRHFFPHFKTVDKSIQDFVFIPVVRVLVISVVVVVVASINSRN